MKKSLLLFVVFCLAYTTKAQISDRINDESTYLLGARPVQGNFGFYMGLSSVDAMSLYYDSVEVAGIPLVNVKYYYTDKLVFKIGFDVMKKRRSIDGEMDPNNTYNPGTVANGMIGYKHVETDARWRCQLGVEKHFDLSNIFDAYVGGNLNIGYARSVRTNNINYEGGDYRENEGSSFGATYGGDLIIGINKFIGDLPLAIGVEYGVGFENYGANKYKYEYEEVMGGVASSGTYYTSLIEEFDEANQVGGLDANQFAQDEVQFTDLKIKRFDVTPLLRFTLTYYLKR